MVRSFTNEFEVLMRKLKRKDDGVSRGSSGTESLDGTIMTGTLFAPALKKLIKGFNDRFGAHLQVIDVENQYFGGDVSVAGLLTGEDFLAARSRVACDFAIIPSVALKGDEPIMLDGMRFEELQQRFDVPLYAFDFSSLAALLTNGSIAGKQQEDREPA